MSRSILVVDDEAHIQQVLTLKLGNAGFEVIKAGDGEEGFELACQHKPDLIITDFQMPYMTGLELCRALAKNEITKGIPIIMLTARGYALSDTELAEVNIKDLLSKPFSPRAVLEQVKNLLGDEDGHSAGSEAA